MNAAAPTKTAKLCLLVDPKDPAARGNLSIRFYIRRAFIR